MNEARSAAGEAGAPEVVGTVDVRGRRLTVAHRPGTDELTPLVLCSGIGSSLRLFDPLVGALDPRRPVVRFDVPGTGTSTAPRVPYGYPTLAATVHGVVRRLGYRRVDVLGISWGGGLAQQFAFQYPGTCRRLVLVATSTGAVGVPAKPATLARMLSPRRHWDARYARRMAGTLYGGTARRDPGAAVEALHSRPDSTSVRGYLYQLLAISSWTSLPLLPLVRQPTLILAGDDDPIIPVLNAGIMATLLPHARLHRYRGGHLALLTEAPALAPVIEEFLW
jgi:poly(3-hydroxyalkanoate) depolymerase